MDEGLKTRIYKELLEFHSKETNNLIKNEQHLSEDISSEKIYEWTVNT